MKNDPTKFISDRIRLERESRGWSLSELSKRSDVSKAMISKIERAETSPTAALLGKLSAAFKLSLSTLLTRAEDESTRLARKSEQAVWIDPDTGYIRQQISSAVNNPIELTQVTLPAGAEVKFPATSYVFLRQVIWIIEGCITFVEGDKCNKLNKGDSYILGEPANCVFRNEEQEPCVYLVVVVRQ
ncbi:MAG: helix-turn-helix transcriptional regulator [Alteromonadaceae bacterium]|nr:helix-turn-helix transcriptional regulator [Alteromonadaceae bacterium]